MYMLITFADGTTEKVFCHEQRWRVDGGILAICTNANTSEWVYYSLYGIRKYQLVSH